MVQVELAKIIIDEKNHDQAVVLKEKGGTRQLPIVIGVVEASNIQMIVSGAKPPRPLTHDLLASVLRALEAKPETLAIDDVLEGTFYAKLQVRRSDGERILVDCRPSDGIALAIRFRTPIFVEEKIFSQAFTNES